MMGKTGYNGKRAFIGLGDVEGRCLVGALLFSYLTYLPKEKLART
jgi:hypothetical protein